METNLSKTTTTTSTIADYQVGAETIDEAGPQKESYYNNPDWPENLKYLKKKPQFKEAIKALARWAVGRGYETDIRTKIILEHITGAGEDSFQSIMDNHIQVKKANGDSYAEVIRNDDKNEMLLNLKPLNPSNCRTVFNMKGLIIGYDVKQGTGKYKRLKPAQIFHSMNNRIANEMHGTSALEACKWAIDARNEAMADHRRILHRSTIRVIYIDMDNATKLAAFSAQYVDAIKQGEVLLLPGRKGEDMEIVDIPPPPTSAYLEWTRYLEGFIYQAIGVPKAIASTQDFTEAASKVGYLTFEPVYVEEQTLLEQDLWNQLGIKVKFNRPPSLGGTIQEDEAKNTGQVGFQPNEAEVTAGRTE